MSNHTIFAWTGPTPPEGYPPFVNISRDEQGNHTITVRGSGDGGRQIACATIPVEALESLLCDLAADLYREDGPRGHDAEVARLMAMTEAEIDAELRSMGIDPGDAARKGEEAIRRALATIDRATQEVSRSRQEQPQGNMATETMRRPYGVHPSRQDQQENAR